MRLSLTEYGYSYPLQVKNSMHVGTRYLADLFQQFEIGRLFSGLTMPARKTAITGIMIGMPTRLPRESAITGA